jgi:hypothetical protein
MNVSLFHTPPTHRELLTKVDITGVTVLKDGKFKNRFPGTPGYQVRANGVLVCSKARKALEMTPHAGKVAKKRGKVIPGTVTIVKLKAANQVNPKKIKHRCIALVNAQAKKKMYAFTITFPPCVGDDMAYKLFNNWLTNCRKYLKLQDYMWVREFQQVGTVHFHMLVPHYFHVHSANRAMQQALITQIKNGALAWHVKAAKRYNGVHIGKNDKTKQVTNFASPRERRALLNYMLKYMSKSKMQNSDTNHYAWHNSRAFSRMITSMTLTEAEARQLRIREQLNPDSIWTNEWFTHIIWKDHSPPGWFMYHMAAINGKILQHLETGKGTFLHHPLELNDSLQQHFTALINTYDMPKLLDKKPVYRQYSEKARSVTAKPERKKLTDKEISDLHAYVQTLPTLDEWRTQNKK